MVNALFKRDVVIVQTLTDRTLVYGICIKHLTVFIRSWPRADSAAACCADRRLSLSLPQRGYKALVKFKYGLSISKQKKKAG